MTVSIDPSEVRLQATVKGQPSVPPSGRASRRPVRVLMLGGLGGAGLLAFTFGAFSFFGGLADPRVRNPRPAPLASKMPDLRDGLPALVSDNGAPASAAPVLNLPRPSAPEPSPASTSASTPALAKAETAMRADAPAEAAAPPAAAARTAAAESTGSVAQAARAAVRPKATPGIENARTVSGDAKPVPLIAPARTAGPLAPAKAETVRAKPAAVAALPAEHEQPSPATPKPAARDTASEAKAAERTGEKVAEKAVRKPAQKSARSKTRPVAEASADPDAAPAHAAAAEPDEDGFTAKVKGGLKAIGGMFGQD